MAVEAGLTMEGGKEAEKDEGERARRGGGEERDEKTKGGRGGGDKVRRVARDCLGGGGRSWIGVRRSVAGRRYGRKASGGPLNGSGADNVNSNVTVTVLVVTCGWFVVASCVLEAEWSDCRSGVAGCGGGGRLPSTALVTVVVLVIDMDWTVCWLPAGPVAVAVCRVNVV